MKSETNTSNNSLCPSYIAKAGASLFGIVNINGTIDYLPEAIKIDETFVEEAKKGRPAEERFRFSGTCVKGSCHQWNKGTSKCGLVNTIIDTLQKPLPIVMQDCAIRTKCRWYAQEGGLSCGNCNEVIRNLEALSLKNS